MPSGATGGGFFPPAKILAGTPPVRFHQNLADYF
jgi:hypothetical protein